MENFLLTRCVFSNVFFPITWITFNVAFVQFLSSVRFQTFHWNFQVENFLATREESVERQRRLAAKTAMLRKTIRWRFFDICKKKNKKNHLVLSNLCKKLKMFSHQEPVVLQLHICNQSLDPRGILRASINYRQVMQLIVFTKFLTSSGGEWTNNMFYIHSPKLQGLRVCLYFARCLRQQ